MESLFYRNNPWWEKGYLFDELVPRDTVTKKVISQFDNDLVVFLTGLRRIGKTSLMKLIIKFLINDKLINPLNIFYISMDEYHLMKFSIDEIVDEFRKIAKLKFNEKVYLFFDEITFKENYDQQLKNLVDNQNVKIVASSSSASLLKKRKAFLTGRNVLFEILPLDFEEFQHFRKIVVSKSDAHLNQNHFETFMQTGGIPEYVLTDNSLFLKDLVDDIIYKDIAAQNNIRDLHLLKDFFLLLMERAGKMPSINKMASILGISPDTSKRYLNLFADTYIIHLMDRHGKTNERLLSAKKIFAADLGIRVYFTGFRDKGSLFENYVYLKIKHLKPRYIYQNQTEIDFITENKLLIEAKYHKMALSEKQQILFDKTPAKEKFIIRNYMDLGVINSITE
jgi:predicted AAA+ superfamily ATPase